MGQAVFGQRASTPNPSEFAGYLPSPGATILEGMARTGRGPLPGDYKLWTSLLSVSVLSRSSARSPRTSPAKLEPGNDRGTDLLTDPVKRIDSRPRSSRAVDGPDVVIAMLDDDGRTTTSVGKDATA